ncbi:peptidase M23 [Vibrio tubiashii]|nr:peptidase M23 [Vibrio tubiashii]
MLSLFARLPWIHRALITLFSALIVIVLFLPAPNDLRQEETIYQVGKAYPLAIDIEQLALQESPARHAVLRWEKHTVGSGDSMALLFQRAGLSSRLLYQLTSSNKEIEKQLTRVRPGDSFELGFDSNNQLIQLKRVINPFETFLITKSDDGYTSELDKKEIHYQYNYAEADITSNFWNAGVNAGLTANQIMELAGIFGWDIDFALDIRSGDKFKILYQEKVVEGEVAGRGKIIAAIFENQGDTFKAIIDDKTGNYYDENGRAMKKAFLRSPLDFRRVSSNFNPSRRHPVTGKVRAHRGTDYAAPVGTPIWAAGDGTVMKSSYNQFNGNYVFIKHSNTYITKYLHLQRRKVKTGQRVKQGQTIGTLGGTGRVTGPHLHYEFLVHGVHKNPRTVKLPQSKSLTGKAKITYIANAKLRLEKLERYGQLLATP